MSDEPQSYPEPDNKPLIVDMARVRGAAANAIITDDAAPADDDVQVWYLGNGHCAIGTRNQLRRFAEADFQ